MKNIIIVLLIFVLPIAFYLVKKELPEQTAVAQDNNNPTLMTFTSTMCSDCKRLKEVLNEVEPVYSSKVNFIRINALDNSKKIQASVKQYNIVLVPTMVFLDKTGNTKKKIEGYIPKDELTRELEGLIND